jgi:flavin-dependent dehydrogenase
MTNQHPITPPEELVDQWRRSYLASHGEFVDYIATQAARWGADQELEACCDVMRVNGSYVSGGVLRAIRRPKPPSDKEMALKTVDKMSDCMSAGFVPMRRDLETIRKVLEALPDD